MEAEILKLRADRKTLCTVKLYGAVGNAEPTEEAA
jgi:hypothetical protein